MISGMRDHGIALACVRLGLPAAHARGADALTEPVAAQWEGSLVRGLESAELSRAYRAACEALLAEIRANDEALALRLEGAFVELISYDQS
jgi:hypothetical protein